TDQYAWGLLAFELLTGLHAIDSVATNRQSTNPADPVAERTLTSEREAQLLAIPHLSHEVAGAIVRSLEVVQTSRFPSMKPIIDTLTTFPAPPTTTDTAPTVSPPTVPVAPPARRRRLASSLPFIALGVLVTGGVVGIVKPWRIVRRVPETVHPPSSCQIDRH